MSLNAFFAKLKIYINNKFIIKYIDNNYWKMTDDTGDYRIITLLKKNQEDQIEKYLPETDMKFEKDTNLKYYNFLIHIFSKYLYKINDCVLDPDHNWAILSHGKVFKYSFPMVEDPWDNVKPRPSLIKFLTKKRPITLEKGILVKYLWNNYYHFFVDTLPQIMLCDKYGLPPDIPLIVPYNFSKIDFVREYFNTIAPPGRKIIIQEKNEYIRIKELFVAKDTFFSDSILDLHSKVPYMPAIEQEGNVAKPALLFVGRNKKYKRTIKNALEIEHIARANGFTIIEAADYTITQQLALFSNATHIIGIHGAGLTNMIFSKSPKVKILEIIPGKNIIPGHYGYLSKLLGYSYKSIEGGGLDENLEFYLNKDVFMYEINEMVN